MAVSVVMPALEMAQETGKLLAWRKREGDRVRKGEALLEIETDKAVVEIEAPGDGILAAITATEGAVVPVGQTIAWLVAPGEVPPATTGAVRISPKARRLATEHGVNLAVITGSGPSGEILAEDILSAISRPSALSPQPSAMSSSFAALMAARTTQSWTTVPHFFISRDLEATSLIAARGSAPGLSHTDLIVSAVARTLVKHPRMHASWRDGAVRPNAEVNVAIAIAVEDAVVTGVVHRADRLSLADVAVRRRELSDRARAGRLQPADIAGATFTISNLGMFQVDAFTAIIVPPQAAILAVGTIADRVVAVNGQPAVRPTMTLTLSCDHRVVDGARAAAFLSDVVELLKMADG
ncbi:MAG TPA: dihydrolipoamide acetyltransferase family protein [Vicinamibacterales bacterium]|nr:dihydrolipoamide acetyltransferase family protein [Vicinamibacterales bacterium]